ncbi:GNAT family N-acetyltransferase [Streptomyces sp. CA-111067]|uniref:GNAT family N-acetyltransferase n=1 Tax=Streptomyces sp. CA-111067 TaxID=3240046 RepID=UPI003D97C68D
MGWTFTESIDRFEAATASFLRAAPVENSVPLTVTAALRRRGADAYGDQPPRFGWWRPDPARPDGAERHRQEPGEQELDGRGPVEAVVLCTPPRPLLLTRAPEAAARELAAAWEGAVPGLTGDREAALVFAEAWRERTGEAADIRREMRIYRLGELTARTPAPPGRSRPAGPDDRELLLRWHHAYSLDVGDLPMGGERLVDDALAHGGRRLWETPDGVPVAMAGSTVPVDGMARILSVYTPPDHRGRGYAGAVTAAVSQAALDAGAGVVLLNADLANPVTNGLYQRLGYRQVRDHVSLAFMAAEGQAEPADRSDRSEQAEPSEQAG